MPNKGKKPKRTSSRRGDHLTETKDGRSATTPADTSAGRTSIPVAAVGEGLASMADRQDAAASLGVLSADASVRSALVASGYPDLAGIATTPRAAFIAALRGKLGEAQAELLHAQASVQSAFLNNLTTSIRADLANGMIPRLPDPTIPPGLPPGFPTPTNCGCPDCQSALGPLAYLANLLDYTKKHITKPSPGLRGEYFDNIDLTNSKLVRADPTVDFDWGAGSPDASIQPDTFSVRWTGWVLPEFSETYTFFTNTDDGVRLWVDDQQLIDDWTDHPPTERSKQIGPLAAGRHHAIAMEYYENTGGAVVQLSWSSPSQPKQIIPNDRLFCSVNDAVDPQTLSDLFHQPFADLPASCDSVEKQLHQVRICVEVLRAHLQSIWDTLTPEQQAAYAREGKDYALAAYQSLLTKLGTSFTEIRLTADDIARQRLANRLGIEVTHLDGLFLDPNGDPAQATSLSEASLEKLFGLVDTTHDPLQAVPTADFETWRMEHLRALWRSEDWPNELDVSRPIIDPDVINPQFDFRDPTPTSIPAALWQTRRTAVDGMLADLKAKRVAGGFGVILKRVLGDPLPADLASLRDNLAKGIDVAATTATITDTLHLTLDSFGRLMAIKDKDDRNDTSNPVSDTEWDEVYAILTQAWKVMQFPIWKSEENPADPAKRVMLGPQQFWIAIGEPTPRQWLASAEVRRQWQEALRIRSEPPLVDPDLIGVGDLKDPTAGTQPFDLLFERQGWVSAQLKALQAIRQSTDLLFNWEDVPGDQNAVTSLEKFLGARFKLSWISRATVTKSTAGTTITVLGGRGPQAPAITLKLSADRANALVTLTAAGQPPSETLRLPAVPEGGKLAIYSDTAIRDELDAVLRQALNMTLGNLEQIETDRKEGHDITSRLDQIPLGASEFNCLLQIRDLGRRAGAVLDAEWLSVCSILVQAQKRRKFAEWGDAERVLQLTLSPDFFRIPPTDPSVFPPQDTFEIVDWRATAQARRGWQDKVQARIDQDQTLTDALADLVSGTEEATLPVLRDALIALADPDGIDLEAKATWVTDRFLIDARAGACQKTTRAAQATETLQLLLWAARTGELASVLPELEASLDDATFDDDWRWIGSCASWRAAMTVYLYPENILLPSLRKDGSNAFAGLVETLRSTPRLTPLRARDATDEYATYFRDVCGLTVEASCDAKGPDSRIQMHLFGRAAGTQHTYWCTFDSDDTTGHGQSLWEPVSFPEPVNEIVGAVPYATSTGRRFIFLFARTEGKAQQDLFVAKYDLDSGRWSEDPIPLDVKIADSAWPDFSVVVSQRSGEDARPHLILCGPTGDLYERELNGEGTDWAGSWSQLEQLPSSQAVLAALEPQSGSDLYLFTSGFNDAIQMFALGAPARTVRPGHGASAMTTNATAVRHAEITHVGDGGSKACGPGTHYDGASGDCVPNRARCPAGYQYDDETGNCELIDRSGDPNAWIVTIGVGTWVGAYLWPQSKTIYSVWSETSVAGGRTVYGVRISQGAPRVDRTLGVLLTSIVPHAGDRLRSDGTYILPSNLLSDQNATWPGLSAFKDASDGLPDPASIRLAPDVSGSIDITDQVSGAHLQERAVVIETTLGTYASSQDFYGKNQRSHLTCLQEAWYFVPLQIALALQQAGQYSAALDWFRTIYDYSAPVAVRKIGLQTEDPTLATDNAGPPPGDPLNPHVIAARHPQSYTRYTLMSLVRCLLEFADVEFTRDTAESLPRARTLYLRALDLLGLPELNQQPGQCERLIQAADRAVRGSIAAGAAQWLPEWNALERDLSGVGDVARLETVTRAVQTALLDGANWEVRFAKARKLVEQARADSSHALSLWDLVRRRAADASRAQAALLALAPMGELAERGAVPASMSSTNSSVPGFVPDPSGFCVPPNPIPRTLRLHADLNLSKLRNCRNIAGMERNGDAGAALPTQYRYATVIERAKQLVGLAQQVESAYLSALEKRDAESYGLLKARQDMQLAVAGVRLQDLKVHEAREGATLAQLQQRRVGIQVDHYAELLNQGETPLEVKSLDLLSQAADWQNKVAQGAEIAQYFPTFGVGASAAGPSVSITLPLDPSKISAASSSQATAASSAASSASTQAGFDRRYQEWQFQKALADQDATIAGQQVGLANDRALIAGQERSIAQTQADHAAAIVDFLANKFTNAELYEWMTGVLGRIYAFFLQQATAMAHLAANQLAFERQEIPPVIQADYWEAPSGTGGGGNGATQTPDRRGLTGSARLLQDIYQLDQYAFATNARKLQLAETISLARFAPYEFQRFRETGELLFSTPLEIFDRRFPGHYLRLIKRVRTSVVALIPPTQGIRATLLTNGVSRAVIGGDVFQSVVVRRDPQSVALVSPSNATGVFELDPQSELLLPFEGLGVDPAWELSMPKAANPFDYRTIADVLITIEYTALASDDYRRQVIQALEPSVSADRPFSFRNQFADQWYDLHNPDQVDAVNRMKVTFETRRENFPPNVEDLVIQQIVLFFAQSNDPPIEIKGVNLLFTSDGAGSPVGGAATTVNGVISTRATNGSTWIPMVGRAPAGTWELALPYDPSNLNDPATALIRDLFLGGPDNKGTIEDILLVITYSGETPAWPM